MAETQTMYLILKCDWILKRDHIVMHEINRIPCSSICYFDKHVHTSKIFPMFEQ